MPAPVVAAGITALKWLLPLLLAKPAGKALAAGGSKALTAAAARAVAQKGGANALKYLGKGGMGLGKLLGAGGQRVADVAPAVMLLGGNLASAAGTAGGALAAAAGQMPKASVLSNEAIRQWYGRTPMDAAGDIATALGAGAGAGIAAVGHGVGSTVNNWANSLRLRNLYDDIDQRMTKDIANIRGVKPNAHEARVLGNLQNARNIAMQGNRHGIQ